MKERALSEVIGFLMIVALLTILFSMYLLYVVPIQGRDAEISHMKYITQEFIGLKADIDGLIINNKVNLPIARSFELGTLSSVGSGSLSVLPLSSFIEATGLLMVNEQNDFLMVTVHGNMADLSKIANRSNNPSGYFNVSYNTEIQVSGIDEAILSFNCFGPEACPYPPINFSMYDRFFNVTTRTRYTFDNSADYDPVKQVIIRNFSINFDNKTYTPIEIPVNRTYDLIVEVYVNNTSGRFLTAEKTLIENLVFPGNYTYNFLKDNDLVPNNSSDYYTVHFDDGIDPGLFDWQAITTKVSRFSPRIGSFQYESSNRYWVNQNLLYEMGGLFMSQPADGGSSVMLIPSIALTPTWIDDPDNPGVRIQVLKVSINNIRITDTEDISGSVSAQIFSKVDHIYQNLFNGTEEIDSFYGSPPAGTVSLWKMREGEETNAKAIWLQFIPDDPRVINSSYREIRPLSYEEKQRMKATTELWKRGFDQVRTITNKTQSDTFVTDSDHDYSRWMYNFRIEDGDANQDAPTSPPYSANLVIGKKVLSEIATDCSPITGSGNAAACQNAVREYLENPDGDEFILDYSESELSLVMQSGAL